MTKKQRVVVTFTAAEFAGLCGLLAAGDQPADFLKYLLSEHQYRLRRAIRRHEIRMVEAEQ